MRLEQVDLYREDIRDLFELTISKMDSYLIVNSLCLAFTMGFFYEGRLPENTPAWLMWLWGTNLLSAVVYLVLSVWFALHAAVTAQTFATRILTQWLRLPVPSAGDIRAAAPRLEDFERGAVQELLRLPVLTAAMTNEESGGFTSTGAALASARIRENLEKQYTDFVEHFQLFRNLQENWTGFDAYARVTMVLGTFHLLYVIGYFALAHFLLAIKQLGAISFVVGMLAFTAVHTRHNIVLPPSAFYGILLLQATGPVLGTVAAVFEMEDRASLVPSWLSPFCFASHGAVAICFLLLGWEPSGRLPTRFSTVVSVDVLGNESPDIPTESAFASQRKPTLSGEAVLNKMPWEIYRISTLLICLVWFLSVIWSSMVACGLPVWRWDNNPTGSNRMAFLHWRYASSS